LRLCGTGRDRVDHIAQQRLASWIGRSDSAATGARRNAAAVRTKTHSVIVIAVSLAHVTRPFGILDSPTFENAVCRRHAIHPLATARRYIGAAGENAGSGDGVGPVLRPAENTAQCAHRLIPLYINDEYSRGEEINWDALFYRFD
jgi:hypothetical protein